MKWFYCAHPISTWHLLILVLLWDIRNPSGVRGDIGWGHRLEFEAEHGNKGCRTDREREKGRERGLLGTRMASHSPAGIPLLRAQIGEKAAPSSCILIPFRACWLTSTFHSSDYCSLGAAVRNVLETSSVSAHVKRGPLRN